MARRSSVTCKSRGRSLTGKSAYRSFLRIFALLQAGVAGAHAQHGDGSALRGGNGHRHLLHHPQPVERRSGIERLTWHIREDEVRHYKHFYHYFRVYREREDAGRGRTLRALWHRLKMIDGEDGLIAMKHVYRGCHPGQAFDKHVYRDLHRRCRHAAGRHFPHEMSIKMLIKPLDLSPRFQHLALPVLTRVARRVVT